MNRNKHKKTLLEWIVYRKAGSSLEYWNGESWVPLRKDAHGFLSPAEAQAFAERNGGTATKR